MNYQLINPIQHAAPIVQILTNRGIPVERIQKFLHPDKTDTYAPTLLMNMRQGAQMLIQHIAHNDPTCLIVDADCDGFTSSALLINFLYNLFPTFVKQQLTYVLHEGKKHGIYYNEIPAGIKLLIVLDAGSNDYEQHKHYAEQGIDILCIDHHQADQVSQYACVINNQLCDYPTKSLSGVGMTYKFCNYIDNLLGTSYADNYLDLVALGEIADVMNTQDQETQYYIQTGLQQIQNPYILEMMRRNTRQFGDGKAYMKDVAWYIAPFINAVTRCGSVEENLLIFESMLDFKANELIPSTKRGHKGEQEKLVEQAGRVCTNVKARQQDLVDAAIQTIEQMIAEHDLLAHKILVIKYPVNNKGMNGLIANKLANTYQRPCLVLQETQDGLWEGSARGYDKSGLKNLREYLLNTGLVEYCAGHLNAFGCGIQEIKLAPLLEKADAELDMIDGIIRYDVDYIWSAQNIPEADVLSIASYKKLWGQQVDEPYVVLENVMLNDNTVAFLGKTGKTLRINIPNTDMTIIKFFCTDDEVEKLTPNGRTMIANVVCYCDINEWNGNRMGQFRLEDIEIVKNFAYYF